jgi:hypothetical protein
MSSAFLGIARGIVVAQNAEESPGAPVERIDTHAAVVFLSGAPRLEAETRRSVRLSRLFDGRTPAAGM